MYTVVGTPRSRAMRVIWALEEVEQPYEIRMAAPRSEAAKTAHPDGKIPALLTEQGDALVDSVAIMTFLADRHGDPETGPTHPAGALARARQDSATQFIVEELDGPLWSAARHGRHYPEAWRTPAIIETNKREFALGVERFAARLGDGPFVSGARFTIADILAGHCFGWAKIARWPAPEDPRILAYLKRIYGRPANDRARARAQAAMREEAP